MARPMDARGGVIRGDSEVGPNVDSGVSARDHGRTTSDSIISIMILRDSDYGRRASCLHLNTHV